MKGCAGLGNRLVTVMAAIEYCVRSNRMLVVDWADGQFDEAGINAFDKCFNFQDFKNYTTIDAIDNWDALTHSSELFKTYRYKSVYELYVEKQNSFFNRFPEMFFPAGMFRKFRRKWQPIDGRGKSLYFGSDLPGNLLYDVVYFVDFLPFISFSGLPGYLGIVPSLMQKIKSFKTEHHLENAIGVHIRATDKKPTQKISSLINYLQSKAKGRHIFLSTDSAAVEEQFKKAFDDIITYSKTKPVLAGEGLHQWALYKQEEKMKYVLYEESVVDMFLLSECEDLLYQGNSTFSKISKVYHKNQAKCIDWQLIC